MRKLYRIVLLKLFLSSELAFINRKRAQIVISAAQGNARVALNVISAIWLMPMARKVKITGNDIHNLGGEVADSPPFVNYVMSCFP